MTPTAPRLHHVFERTADATPDATALEVDERSYSYRELDERANQVAHHLHELGVRPGARVAILLIRSLETYLALLGIGKAGAAFVPIDPESPQDRVSYIAEDADVDLVVTATDLADRVADLGRRHVELDVAGTALDAQPTTRPETGTGPDDPPAYVIYTSGSSGRPKGVEVAQSSISNFIDVVPPIYDVRRDDRVYQGMTISFDFSVEEIWPTWAVGATVVAGPNDSRRLGADLADFLEETAVTVFYTVPTLLATIPRDLAGVRTLVVGGEACPAELVERWAKPGRRMLNTYGPTEATVTATWCELVPGKPVTIGRPLPTYTAELRNDQGRSVPHGEVGEIALGGPGVARGYVGRPELTAEKFVAHPDDPTGRTWLYRTGDLGRFTDDGEIEYLGRADAEVKVRGHRVDLGEIESVLLEDEGVSAAVVAQVESSGELAAYVVPANGDTSDREGTLAESLRPRLTDALPSYMVPATLDLLTELPTQVSGKVDRSALPAPEGRRLIAATGPRVAAEGELEEQVAQVWAEVFGLERDELSVEADFFDDLGGHSLLAATVVTRMRERDIGASPTVRQLYGHPTVRALAGELSSSSDHSAAPAPVREEPLRHGRGRVAAAGSAQAVLIYLFLLVVTLPASVVYTVYEGTVGPEVLVALIGAGVASWLVVRWILPPLVVRLLTLGIRPGRHPLWGLTHVRLWASDLLLGVAPLPVLSGSPLMPGYLRLLGARVGRDVHVATSDIGLPTLVEIADGASVGYGSALHPWIVEDGWVLVSPVRIGRDAYVAADTVLEPGTTVGDRSALLALSVLERGQTLPDGRAWAGSPPIEVTDLDADLLEMLTAPRTGGWTGRLRVAAAAGVLGLELTSIAMIVPSVLLVWAALLSMGVLASLVATLLTGPLFVITVCALVAGGKRLVLPRTPAGLHSLHSGLGLRKWIADKLLEFSLTYTNSLYATLYTPAWLRLLGADVGRGAEVSTASHIDPDLLVLGRDSFVADMASVGSTAFGNGRMLLRHTEVGDRSFVGNAAQLPGGTRTGKDSLVGVATVPGSVDVPTGSSWVGSPAINLPARQESEQFDEQDTFRPRPRRVAQRLAIEFVRATLPASVLAIGLYLYLLGLSIVAGSGAGLLVTALVAPLLFVAVSLAIVLYIVGVKRNVIGAYEPRVEPLWSPYVRRSEFVTGLYEAAAVPALLNLLVGTPFLPMVLRLFGTHIGARVWMGTTFLTEFDLVEVGDDAAIGPKVSLQTHLFEDRVMKMSEVRVADGATVGARSVVLYDSVVGRGVSLEALSLLMKGEELTPESQWRGIPAEGASV